jgi:hypothetical protein
MIWVGIGCGLLALFGLCLVPPLVWLGMRNSDDDDDVEADGPIAPIAPAMADALETRRVTFTVTQADNVPNATSGMRCAFDVTRHNKPDGSFWCNAQIACGTTHLLYGGPTAGFFDCTLYNPPELDIVGQDGYTTSEDSDAAMRLNTRAGELEIHDDQSGASGAFTLRGHVTSVVMGGPTL